MYACNLCEVVKIIVPKTMLRDDRSGKHVDRSENNRILLGTMQCNWGDSAISHSE